MKSNYLQGPNINLRAPEPSDLEFLYEIENDSSVWNFGNTLVPYSRFQIEQYLLSVQHDIFSEKQLHLMIETRTKGMHNQCIGTVDLFEYDPHHQRAGIGIVIIESEREKGFAAEALDLIIDYGFNILKLHQLYCTISANNKKSLMLFEKKGFIPCGVKQDWRLEEGEWVDEIMLQLLKS